MHNKRGFQFTEDDLEILRHTHELRIAHIDHLAALTARSHKALSRRLLKLHERRFLACITRRPQKHIYAIGREGVCVLTEHGYAPPDLAEKRLRHAELKEIAIKHFLFVVDIHVRLLRLTQGGPINIINWREGPSLWDHVSIRYKDGRGEVMPVRPDASFTLQDKTRPDGKNELHFFLEADRSTMSHARMASKITGYLNYYQQGLHRRKYPGMRSFQVATITQTRERAQRLKLDLQRIIPRPSERAYAFAAFDDLTLAVLLPSALQPGFSMLS